MTRLLIIEDERQLADALAQGLREDGYDVDVARDGEAGLWAAQAGEHALVVLDLQLPKLSGLELCRRLRAKGIATPILILTARDTVSDIVNGLDAGASDYLVKPFVFEELRARARAILRTAAGATSSELTVADLRLDSRGLRVWRGGSAIVLTVKEHRLLEQLMRCKGEVVSRQRLTAALWDHDNDPDSNALEVHVASLRRKLGRGADSLLHTVRGVGYVMREPSA